MRISILDYRLIVMSDQMSYSARRQRKRQVILVILPPS